MRKLYVAVLAALAATAAAVAVGIAAPSPPLSGTIVLVGNVQERNVIPPDGKFPGRSTWYFTLASARARGKAFGYGILSCVFVSTKNTVRECVGTYSLPRGKLTVAGSFLYPSLYELAITGGTGAYNGAAGILDVREFVAHKGAYWLTFTLR